jgi:hypothetical protein
MNKIVKDHYDREIADLRAKIVMLESLRTLTDRVYELIKQKLQESKVKISSYRISVDFKEAEAELELKLQEFRVINLDDIELKKLTRSVWQVSTSVKATIAI